MRVLLYKDLNTRRIKAAFAKVRAFINVVGWLVLSMRSANPPCAGDGVSVIRRYLVQRWLAPWRTRLFEQHNSTAP